jgi:hypothetical protein
MRAVLRLCREHGQPPAWWDTLPNSDQALLLADLRMRANG